MHHPTDWIAHTTAFVTPVVEHWLEREIVLKKKKIFRNKYRQTNCLLLNFSALGLGLVGLYTNTALIVTVPTIQ